MFDLYIASCDEKGGIHWYETDGKTVVEKDFTPLDRPMYMQLWRDKLYCVLRDPENTGDSGIVTFDVTDDGTLINKSESLSTCGVVGCHLTATEKGVFCANYVSGSVFRTPDLLVTHTGKGVHPTRQEKAHTHCTALTPDGKYVCVCDLGIDKILLYDLALHPVSETKLPDGSGPRHVVFSDDGAFLYCVTELSNEVFSFAYRDGRLTPLKNCSTLPKDADTESFAAAIRLQNEFLYVSNRGHDSIAVFHVKGGDMTPLCTVPCGGAYPRDFNVSDDLLVCTNENSNTVTFFALENGIPKPTDLTIELPKPLNVIFRERK